MSLTILKFLRMAFQIEVIYIISKKLRGLFVQQIEPG
jgi:hypothetical protein